MPEGHTIHRAARLQRRALRGGPLCADSPQGRFDAGAAVLNGRSVEDVEAYGKHLFYRWSDDVVLHVHLGLFGRFQLWRREAADEPLPTPTPGTRLRLVGDDVVLHLAGATACELVDPAQEEVILARLGPDPLARRASPSAFVEALHRRRIGVAAALLDQRVICGIGNVYRAELLFLAGIHPERPARDVSADAALALWSSAVEQLRAGERSGRIVTVDPAEVGAASRGRVRRGDRLYVYKRTGEPCRRCGTPIAAGESAGRRIFWCPRCQPD